MYDVQKKKTQNKQRSKYVALNNKKVLTESKTILHDAMIDSSLTQDAMCACFFLFEPTNENLCFNCGSKKFKWIISVCNKKNTLLVGFLLFQITKQSCQERWTTKK